MKIYSFIFLLFLCAYNTPKEKHPIFLENTHIIEDAKEIEIFTLENIATPHKQHDKKEIYFEDFKVLKKLNFVDEQSADLKKIVLEKGNYLEKSQKKCPFKTAHAIKFFKNKRDFIVLIVSENTCEKMLISSSERDINKKYVDLAEKNTIHEFLGKMEK